ncbi:hypothetical protein PtrEW13061_011274 [Pyrenophora tritici-repentis]|nr:hypothetical protein PtrEW13061_011274 [Pyrenophora tritici-repentis]
MAEALAIIGLVTNIIAFIDFGLKVASGVRNVRESMHGTTADIHELELILADVRRYNDQIRDQKRLGRSLSKHEAAILAMVRECNNVAYELQKAIEKLKVRTWRSRTLENGRIAFQTLRKQRYIDSLRERLDSLDKRIRDNIKHLIRGEEYSAISTKLDNIKRLQEALKMNYDAKLDVIRDEILSLVQQSSANSPAIQMAELASLKTKFDILQKEHLECVKQADVIRSLYLPVLRRRWNQIPQADQLSNDWVFNTEKTSFKPWLESQENADALFCITGKASFNCSGKSTLMKYISEDPRTTESLEKWAGPAKLYTASYFFWNQGYEMQKNKIGLFQSLLYQILKSAPDLIPLVIQNRLKHEEWEVEELKATFERIAGQTELNVKYCFFIDGLDEYNGAEEEVVEMLTFLSTSNAIKICASTRPRSVFERFFCNSARAFDIARFTKADMMQHVQHQLYEDENFRRLESIESRCEDIKKMIAELAQGVWLWVFLVTRDLKIAVNRDEGVDTLRKIILQFPTDLEEYFERIINSIRPQYLEEMSQIFLITVDELQPLPLYAFSLLEKERQDPDYAIKAPIKELHDRDLYTKYPAWKSHIRNRCSDLLVVDDEPVDIVLHSSYLSHPVDFLHRTVRDFLQDSYYTQLRANLRSSFVSTVSLCRMCLVLLKALPAKTFSDFYFRNSNIGLTDQLIYYAHETEKRDETAEYPLVGVLDELDRVNTHFASGMKNHWTHARDSADPLGLDVYREGGNCNFLALMVPEMSTSKSSWLDSYRLQITDNIEARAQWHVPENGL